MAGFNKQKATKGLAWVSFVFAAVAGNAAASTFIGDLVRGMLGFFPGWVASVIFVGAAVALAIDLFVDGEPNQIAIYSAMALPSLARSVPGKLGDTVSQGARQLAEGVNGVIGGWLGVTSLLATAAVCAAVALLMARRVVKKGGR